jgi:hypothetical protein
MIVNIFTKSADEEFRFHFVRKWSNLCKPPSVKTLPPLRVCPTSFLPALQLAKVPRTSLLS